jgi:spore coat protein U-like protein
MRTNHHLKTTAFINKREKSMKTKFNQRKIKLAIASAIIAAGAAGLSATSYAATDTATMAVTTSVSMSCTITAGAMTFVSYNPTAAADNDATATITSTCTTGGAAVITMGEGGRAQGGSTATIPLRAMFNGSEGTPEDLLYHLYSDSAGGTVWGNTAETGKAITADGTAQALQPMAGFLRTKQLAPDLSVTASR